MPYKELLKRRAGARKAVRAYTARLRLRLLMALGGKCERCGINDSRVLQLDHKNGGGYRETQVVGANGKKYRNGTHVLNKDAMTRLGDFQLLCANCNWIKRFERGEHGGDKSYLAAAVGG